MKPTMSEKNIVIVSKASGPMVSPFVNAAAIVLQILFCQRHSSFREIKLSNPSLTGATIGLAARPIFVSLP